MFRTKQGGSRSAATAMRAPALALVLAMMGCADSGGLRSVWPDRPTLLGFRDRKPQPSPDPADDYYARYMRAARERYQARSKSGREDEAAPNREESGPPGPEDTLVAEESRPASRPSPRSVDNDGDEPLRVSLGKPEPLPSTTWTADPALASSRPRPSREAGDRRTSAGREPAPARVRQDEERVGSNDASTPAEPAPEPPTRPTRRATAPAQDAQAILAKSEARLRSLNTYQVKMSRIERVGGQLQPEEEFLLSIHRQPREVRLEWASGPSQGREVIYSARVDDRSLFVHMPRGAIALPTMKMAIDSPMVTRSSRHSITEAGFDTIIESLRKSVDATDAAQGCAVYRGIEKPPGLDRPSHVFTRRSPNGETWTVFLDARSLLPSMVVAKNPAGELDEKYVYHEVSDNPADLATADAFDPDRRWGASKGLLGRFARGGAALSSPGNGQSTMR